MVLVLVISMDNAMKLHFYTNTTANAKFGIVQCVTCFQWAHLSVIYTV